MYIDTFEKVFTLEDEDIYPSSFWTEDALMFEDEDLPVDLKVYSSWEEYRERTRGGWLWHAPKRIFRFPSDNTFLLAQNKRKWVVYNTEDRKLHIQSNGLSIQSFKYLTDVLKSIYE